MPAQDLEADSEHYAERSITIRLREKEALYKALCEAEAAARAARFGRSAAAAAADLKVAAKGPRPGGGQIRLD